MKNMVKLCLSTLPFKEMRQQGTTVFSVYWSFRYSDRHKYKKPTLILSVLLVLHRTGCAHSSFGPRHSSVKMKPDSSSHFFCKTS